MQNKVWGDVAWALSLAAIMWALAWGVRGCVNVDNELTKRTISKEETKRIQYQWKIDSLKGVK